MKMIRVLLHGLVLVLVDLVGIVGGALAAFQILGVPNQVWLHLPIAILLSVAGFCAWSLSLRLLRWTRLQAVGSGDLKGCLALSLLWAPLVFVPLHYFTQGYVTALGNLVALALYQLPVNALALFCSSLLQPPVSAVSPQDPGAPNGRPAVFPGHSGVTEGPPSVS